MPQGKGETTILYKDLRNYLYQDTYIDFHVLIETIVHDQTMCQANSVRLHRMSCDICVIADVGVVEISHAFLIARIQVRRIDGGNRRHEELLCQQ